jgi:hypothetical protein
MPILLAGGGGRPEKKILDFSALCPCGARKRWHFYRAPRTEVISALLSPRNKESQARLSTLITPRATRGGQTPKGIIFPEDSATLGQLSVWPRGGLLLEKCLTFASFWPWAISPSAALAKGGRASRRGNRYGIGTVRPPCQNCETQREWQCGKDTRTQSGMS